jgi:hypothetical protein
MLRWFALTVMGLFALYRAWHFHVTPLDPSAPERTGWLFQRFGQQGIAVGMLLMAIVFAVIGVIGMLRRPRHRSGLVASQKGREGAVRRPVSLRRHPGQRFNVLQLRIRAGAKQAFGRHLSD